MNYRKCFICGSTEGESLFEENWDITGLGKINIGFRFCSNCGIVIQDPLAPPEKMNYFYTNISNYTNPGRDGMPSQDKIKAVDRQMSVLKKYQTKKGKVFQVGCSDGYTLYRFREDGWVPNGTDPSITSIKIAQKLYNLLLTTGVFEEYTPTKDEKYELILLTHILEHLYEPQIVLQKCSQIIEPSGCILIEVPVLINPEHWPPGYFSFEHVNYFSEQALKNLCNNNGFKIDEGSITISPTQLYPVITCIAYVKNERTTLDVSRKDEVLSMCKQYLDMEKLQWERIDCLLQKQLQNTENCIIWGAGIHTSQLLIRTNIEEYSNIEYIVDNDSQKWGLFLGNYKIISPEKYFSQRSLSPIIISSYSSEKEIYNDLINKVQANVIRLYK